MCSLLSAGKLAQPRRPSDALSQDVELRFSPGGDVDIALAVLMDEDAES